MGTFILFWVVYGIPLGLASLESYFLTDFFFGSDNYFLKAVGLVIGSLNIALGVWLGKNFNKFVMSVVGDDALMLENAKRSAARPASNQSSNTSIQQPMAAAGPTISSIDDDELYQQALEELDNDQKVAATWSRSFAEASGDEQKAKAYYIQLRVAGLKATAEVKKNEMEQEKQEAVEAAELKMKEIEREKQREIEAREWVDSLKKKKERDIKIGFITLGLITIFLIVFAAS